MLNVRRRAVLDLLHHNWLPWLVAIGYFFVTLIFANYLAIRQRLADERAQQARLSLCAILDRIPQHLDSGMDRARRLDTCGRPHPPTVFFGRPFPTPRPTVTVTPRPVIERPPVPSSPGGVTPTPAASSSPAPSRTAPPRPTPRPTPSRTHPPKPSPSPSRLCVLFICP